MEKIISCYVSKHGLPTLAESGGAKQTTGYANMITNKDGRRKTPIYVFRNASPNGEHALFVIKENDLRIEVLRSQNYVQVDVFKIKEIDVKNKKVILSLIESCSEYTYTQSLYYKAISVAIHKSKSLYCKEAMYTYSKNKQLEKNLITTN